jgi:hypothetical protein
VEVADASSPSDDGSFDFGRLPTTAVVFSVFAPKSSFRNRAMVV